MQNIQRMLVAVVAAALLPAIASQAADSPATEKDPAKLVALLKSEAPLFDKAKACQRLAAIGGKDAVPALADLLSDPKLAHYARFGLQANPDSSVDDAFRAAMDKLQGRLLVGVINSISMRRDAKATEALAARLSDSDAEVASASAAALGRIGNLAAAEALAKYIAIAPASVRPFVTDACFVCAERLTASGSRRGAARLYDVVRKADVPRYQLLAATRWAILVRQAGGVDLLIDEIRADDRDRFHMGLRVARELPGAGVTKALAAQYDRLPPARQALLVALLADRRDAAALPAILKAAQSEAVATRLAAVGMLAKLGDPSTIAVLWQAAVDDDAAIAAAAQAGLTSLRSAQVDAAVVAKLKADDPKVRRIAMELAGLRRIASAEPMLRAALNDSAEPVRLAAVKSLGMTMNPKDLSPLIDRMLASSSKPEIAAAQQGLKAACMRSTEREASATQVIASLSKASPAQKAALFEVLSAAGGTAALDAVAAAAKRGELDQASRLLGEWMSPDAAPVLRDLVASVQDERYKTRALRGYIRLARQLDMPVAQRIAICKDAIGLAWRAEEKKLAVQVLGRHATPEALALVVEQLGDAAVKPAAVASALKIADKAATTHPEAVAKAMKRLLEVGVEADQADRAKALLEKAEKASK